MRITVNKEKLNARIDATVDTILAEASEKAEKCYTSFSYDPNGIDIENHKEIGKRVELKSEGTLKYKGYRWGDMDFEIMVE